MDLLYAQNIYSEKYFSEAIRVKSILKLSDQWVV